MQSWIDVAEFIQQQCNQIQRHLLTFWIDISQANPIPSKAIQRNPNQSNLIYRSLIQSWIDVVELIQQQCNPIQCLGYGCNTKSSNAFFTGTQRLTWRHGDGRSWPQWRGRRFHGRPPVSQTAISSRSLTATAGTPWTGKSLGPSPPYPQLFCCRPARWRWRRCGHRPRRWSVSVAIAANSVPINCLILWLVDFLKSDFMIIFDYLEIIRLFSVLSYRFD